MKYIRYAKNYNNVRNYDEFMWGYFNLTPEEKGIILSWILFF